MKAPTTTTATQLLRSQHERVKEMFEQITAAEGKHRAELFDCLRATLAVHETAEEVVIHPAVRRLGPTGDSVVEARLAEEYAAKKALAELEKLTPKGTGFGPKLLAFQQDVLRHAEAEEFELFPLLDTHCDHDEMLRMAEMITSVEHLAPTHPHRHGPNSALGLMLVGPFVSMVDRVRDKLAS